MGTAVLIRYSSEMTLKGHKAQRQFVARLKANIERSFCISDVTFEIYERRNHLQAVVSDVATASAILRRTFGVGYFLVGEWESKMDLDQLKQIAGQHLVERVRGKTFAVRCRRTGASHLSPKQIERELGTVLAPFAKVQLKNPQVTVRVEIINQRTYVSTEKVLGPGGFPAFSQGRALVLMSGGFDSAVAAWMVMKRGVAVDFLFCNLGGSAYQRLVLQISKVLVDLWARGQGSQFYSMDFSDLSAGIKKYSRVSYRQLILKRYMYRAANAIAERTQAQAIVTGECIAQVSSQTLTNLGVIEEVAALPVLRPVVAMDKQEIMNLAKTIGTGVLSERVKEYCDISAGSPVIFAERRWAHKSEPPQLDEILAKSLEEFRTTQLDSLTGEQLREDHLFIEDLPHNYEIIDCQGRGSFETWHADRAIHVDFDELLKCYTELDRDKKYVVYCTFGTKSPIAAEIMQQSGYEAYAFRGGLAHVRRASRN